MMTDQPAGAEAFVVIAEFAVPEAARAEFLVACGLDADGSAGTEPGCRQFDVLVDPAAPGTVVLFEIYDDAAAFEAHKQTAHYAAYASEVARLGLAAPSVRLLRRAHRGGA